MTAVEVVAATMAGVDQPELLAQSVFSQGGEPYWRLLQVECFQCAVVGDSAEGPYP